MRRGEVYWCHSPLPERGGKPGFYTIVSRDFIARSELISTVVCAPVYSEVRGLETEVPVGPEEGVKHPSVIRCDYLTLMFKSKLSRLAGRLGEEKLARLDRALKIALDIRG